MIRPTMIKKVSRKSGTNPAKFVKLTLTAHPVIMLKENFRAILYFVMYICRPV
jgi:hypothetical protein